MKKLAPLLLQLGFHPKKSKIKSLKSATFKTGGYENNRLVNGRTSHFRSFLTKRQMWHQFWTIRHHFSWFGEKILFFEK